MGLLEIPQIEEGTLKNSWYVDTFTRRVGIEKDFYHNKKILDIGCGPRGSLEWADMAAERRTRLVWSRSAIVRPASTVTAPTT